MRSSGRCRGRARRLARARAARAVVAEGRGRAVAHEAGAELARVLRLEEQVAHLLGGQALDLERGARVGRQHERLVVRRAAVVRDRPQRARHRVHAVRRAERLRRARAALNERGEMDARRSMSTADAPTRWWLAAAARAAAAAAAAPASSPAAAATDGACAATARTASSSRLAYAARSDSRAARLGGTVSTLAGGSASSERLGAAA